MKNQKKLIVRLSFLSMILGLIGIGVAGQKLKALSKKIDVEISVEEKELERTKARLSELEEELAEMDSEDYIEKIAKEQLGMVDEDTIVIREKK